MRSFIFGTDWGEDCDDVVALRVILRHHKAGKARLLGAVINTCAENSVSSMYGFLAYEGVDGIAVGIDRGVSHVKIETRYQTRLTAYAPDKTNDDAEDAVRLYRRLIAEADGKVEIIEVGFLQALAGAIMSEGDDISPKTGLELFAEKVEKIWIMGGKWNEQFGKEYNFCRHSEARVGSSIVCEKCPCPITFLGWEIGSCVSTGDFLDEDDLLYGVLCDWHGRPSGRESWDPMTALLAMIGDEEKAGYSTVSINPSVNSDTGANTFEENPDSNRKFVIKKFPDSYYIDMINDIIKTEK